MLVRQSTLCSTTRNPHALSQAVGPRPACTSSAVCQGFPVWKARLLHSQLRIRCRSVEAQAASTDVTDVSLLQLPIASGKLHIVPVDESHIRSACLMMTRVFAAEERFSLTDATNFTTKVVQGGHAKGLVLAARLVPTDEALLPPNQTSRLVGTVTLSYHADTRPEFPTLPPPSNVAYLSNMAVEQKFRRQGIARAMLQACDAAAKSAGFHEIYLHVNQQDLGAQGLYNAAGYSEVSRDGGMSVFKLKGKKARLLMKKAV